MNNDYIQNASAFLDSLIQEMNVELFIQQYQTLDHENLSKSIPLNDKKIHNYYDACLQTAKKKKSVVHDYHTRLNIVKESEFNNQQFWKKLLIAEVFNLSHEMSKIEVDFCSQVKVIRSHQSTQRSQDLYDLFINKFTDTLSSERIVNEEKYNNTFDTLDIAA